MFYVLSGRRDGLQGSGEWGPGAVPILCMRRLRLKVTHRGHRAATLQDLAPFQAGTFPGTLSWSL